MFCNSMYSGCGSCRFVGQTHQKSLELLLLFPTQVIALSYTLVVYPTLLQVYSNIKAAVFGLAPICISRASRDDVKRTVQAL